MHSFGTNEEGKSTSSQLTSFSWQVVRMHTGSASVTQSMDYCKN